MYSQLVTTDLCDELGEGVAVCALPWRTFGARATFAGLAATVRCFEDNVLVRNMLSTPGQDRVLVVDGGGSHRVALLGDQMAALAAENRWAAVVLNGAIRDAERLAAIDLGIVALGTNPRRSRKQGEGTTGEPVCFGGVTFSPGDLVVGDADGVVVRPRAASA